MQRVLLSFVVALAAVTLPAQRPQPGPGGRSKIPDGWVAHETRNCELQSEVGEARARRLGEHMEDLNKVYRRLFRPDRDGAKRHFVELEFRAWIDSQKLDGEHDGEHPEAEAGSASEPPTIGG